MSNRSPTEVLHPLKFVTGITGFYKIKLKIIEQFVLNIKFMVFAEYLNIWYLCEAFFISTCKTTSFA